MIDHDTWASGLALLCTHFNLDLIDSPVESIWREYLDSQLNSGQFTKAVKSAVIKLPVNKPPTPEQLAEFGGSGKKMQIIAQWERIEEGRKRGGIAPGDVKAYDSLIDSLDLDLVALKALKTLGGILTLSRLSDEAIRWTRKEFFELYEAWDAQREQLELEAEAINSVRAFRAEQMTQAIEASRQKYIAALPPASSPIVEETVLNEMKEASERMAIPAKPVKVVGTAGEYQAIARDVMETWRLTGKINEVGF
jgi:hypothetical protein